MGRPQSGLSHDRRVELVVVALPAEDDQVRKYSSEKEPHLTLLYLGEAEFEPAELAHITEYIAHASSLVEPFMLEVERRGVLGEKEADVLFFAKRYAKEMNEFRGYLLQDQLINLAYLSVEQFPSWTPHLMMGFPDTPAKKDDREYNRFSYVRFDRIALWTSDSDGPTFPLTPDYDSMEVAMSQFDVGQQAVDEILHYGVKGMKWGQRRAQKQMAKADRKWEDTIYSTRGAIAVHNEMAGRMNGGEIDKHNNNPKWKGVNLNKNPKLNKEYYDAYAKLEDRIYKEAVTAVHGKSPSGSKKAVYINDDRGPRIEIKSSSAKHADEDVEPDLVILLEQDELGQVSEQNEAQTSAEHGDTYSQSLMHYGVKGMKWGKRKARIEGARAPESAATKATQKKAKATKVSSLSNKELQDAITRMNLEKQFNQLNPKRLEQGQKAVKALLGVGNTANQVVAFNNSPAGQAIREGIAKSKA